MTRVWIILLSWFRASYGLRQLVSPSESSWSKVHVFWVYTSSLLRFFRYMTNPNSANIMRGPMIMQIMKQVYPSFYSTSSSSWLPIHFGETSITSFSICLLVRFHPPLYCYRYWRYPVVFVSGPLHLQFCDHLHSSVLVFDWYLQGHSYVYKDEGSCGYVCWEHGLFQMQS